MAVAGQTSDRLLGVRDGFLRFFHEGIDRPVSVAVVPQTAEEPPFGLLISDEAVIGLARQRAMELEKSLADNYHFYVASEGGLHSIEIDGKLRYFVRNWTVVRGLLGEASGSSGSVQLPDRIVDGLDSDQVPFAVPGTRKSGGITSSLTAGLETRRRATATATLHAVSTLFHGRMEGRRSR